MRLTITDSWIAKFARVAITIAVCWTLLQGDGDAQTIHPYRTPSSISIASLLQQPCRVSSGTVPLLDLVQQWKMAYAIPVWLDRRIATDQVVSVHENWATVSDSLNAIAKQLRAEVAMVDGSVMIVPSGLSMAIEDAYWSLMVGDVPEPLLRREKVVLSWDEGAIASDILRDFATRFPLIQWDPNSFEHDVWRAGSWENTTPIATALGLLSSFDKTLVVREGVLAAGDLPREVDWVSWQYRDEIAKLGKGRWLQWRERWKEAEVRRIDEVTPAWMIRAPVAAHRELVEPLAPPPPARGVVSDSSKVRYTGRYRGELHSILQSFAKQKGWELDVPDLPPSTLRQELDLVFEQATLEDVLTRIGEAAGLELRQEGNFLRVQAR
jgi:hypothetical protein